MGIPGAPDKVLRMRWHPAVPLFNPSGKWKMFKCREVLAGWRWHLEYTLFVCRWKHAAFLSAWINTYVYTVYIWRVDAAACIFYTLASPVSL